MKTSERLITRGELAERTGYNYQTIDRYKESGLIKPSVYLGKRKIAYYDVKLVRILREKKLGEYSNGKSRKDVSKRK